MTFYHTPLSQMFVSLSIVRAGEEEHFMKRIYAQALSAFPTDKVPDESDATEKNGRNFGVKKGMEFRESLPQQSLLVSKITG